MTISIRLDDATVRGLKRLADADDRKLSPYLARVLKRHLDAETKASEKKRPKGGASD